MNRIITYGSVEAIPFYNCSRKTFAEWETTGTKRQYFGYPLVVFGIFIELLYIPIIYIIFKTKLIRHACYKIMVFLAMIDMSATCCSCLVTGPLLILGSVFCMYPTFTYIAGGFVFNTWCMASATTVSLFINRIISISFRKYGDMIEKKLAYFSIALVTFYGFYTYCFTPTICFNSEIMAWIADPLSEATPSNEAAAMYKNTVQAWNNWIFVICMFFLFSLYYILIKKLAKGQNSKASKTIFLQCSLICFFNTVIALVYNALAIVTPAPWILVFTQICWACNHACPAIIYVTMNGTIRKEFLQLILRVRTTHVTDLLKGSGSLNISIQKVDDNSSASTAKRSTLTKV